jgi:hypothetical protein
MLSFVPGSFLRAVAHAAADAVAEKKPLDRGIGFA